MARTSSARRWIRFPLRRKSTAHRASRSGGRSATHRARPMRVVPIVNRMSRCWRRVARHAKGTGAQLVDQALFQYERFAGFDGQFLDNVVLQNKNGPCEFSRPLCLLSFPQRSGCTVDFQVREPVHSLFGKMPRCAATPPRPCFAACADTGAHPQHQPDGGV